MLLYVVNKTPELYLEGKKTKNKPQKHWDGRDLLQKNRDQKRRKDSRQKMFETKSPTE